MDKEIQKEINEGRIWRAKEILRDKIGQSGYDKELFEDYGNVLALMHDDVTAGKSYFLSGVRNDEYQKNIDLFLEKHARTKLGSLTSQFPKSAKYQYKHDFPETIKNELFKLGLIDSPSGGHKYKYNDSFEEGSLDILRWVIIIIVILISIPVGVGTIIYWIYKLIVWLAM